MRNAETENFVIFIILSTLLIILLISFISFVIYRYQQKQNAYFKDIEELKSVHENEMLHSQIEIQEQTFENISREIHDNIGQKLTLVKLHLNTLDLNVGSKEESQLEDSILILSDVIKDLSDISRSMSAEIILNNGLIKALEIELAQLNKSRLFRINLLVIGEPIFMDSKQELILFRILQEALNNVIKHANANKIEIELVYKDDKVSLGIIDDGRGFLYEECQKNGTGLSNMKNRAERLLGKYTVRSKPGEGTNIIIELPIHKNEKCL